MGQLVYRFYQSDDEVFSYDLERLDGDLSKVGPVDLTPDDGKFIRDFSKRVGRPIDPTHLPTKIRLKGPKRGIADVYLAGATLVDEKFRAVVEQLEPDTHQFFPVDLQWTDGTPAGKRYWFFVCNRLDTVDRDKTTKEYREKTTEEFVKRVYVGHGGDGEFVFNRGQIGGHHIWIDKHMISADVLMSAQMHDALVAAGITGMGFEAFAETD